MTSYQQRSSTDGAFFDLGVVSREKLYATENPSVSYFGVRPISRHYDFAIADADYQFNDTSMLSGNWGTNTTLRTPPRVVIPGDLLLGVVANFTITRLDIPVGTVPRPGWVPGPTTQFLNPGELGLTLMYAEDLGHALLKSAAFKINTGESLESVSDVHMHDIHETRTGYERLLVESLGRLRTAAVGINQASYTNTAYGPLFACVDRQLHVPLPFSFLRGGPFPIAAASNAQILVELVLRSRSEIINAYFNTGAAGGTGPYFSLNPNTQVIGGNITASNLTFRVCYLTQCEQAQLKNGREKKYYEYIQPFSPTRVNAGTLTVDINLPIQHSVTELAIAYRSNEATNALTRTYGLTSNAVVPNTGSATVPRLEYFNYSTPIPPTLLPDRVDNTGAAVTPSPALIGNYMNPLRNVQYLVNNGGIVRSARTGVWDTEIEPFLSKSIRCELNNYVAKLFFARLPAVEYAASGSTQSGSSQTGLVRVDFTGLSGIAEAGQILVWARTQGYYVAVGGQIGMEWPANEPIYQQ